MSHKDGKIIRETIRVYCRLRPPIPEDEYVWDGDDDVEGNNGEAQLAPVRKDGFSSISQVAPPAGSCANNNSMKKDGQPQQHWGTFAYKRSPQDATLKEFRFHGFFGPTATQEQVYETVARDIVKGVLEGYNGTIFAYGQTGSGKTHTMRGEGKEDEEEVLQGLTPRALQAIFEGVHNTGEGEVTVTLSYLQIYCEMLQDLFDPTNTNLSIRERDGRVFVEGLSRVPVKTLKQCMSLLVEGDANRTTACTKLNASSSRSHAALLVNVTRREDSNNLADGSTLIESTLYLVDLAGSERAKRSGSSLQRFEELKAINLSLSALGNCISALSQGRPHIPYRDSKLTRLLQQSLGGNSRTCLMVTVPPGHDVAGESHCSLLFAQRAMNVAVVAKVNRQIDYAQLYNTAQARLDQHDDTLTKLQIEKAKQQEGLNDLQSRVEELTRENAELAKKLKAAEAGFKEGLRALESTSMDPGGERAVAAVETVSQKWRAEVENLESMHAREVKELKAKYERRLAAYKHSLDQANEGWQAVELELTTEREGHLATLTDYRKCHERLLHTESESSARIAELLSEVNDKTNAVEELQADLGAARDRAKQREEMLGKLQLQLRDMELQQQQHVHPAGGPMTTPEAFVPKSQVQTMEKLFAETVGRLEDRVQHLETSGAAAAGRASNVSTGVARGGHHLPANGTGGSSSSRSGAGMNGATGGSSSVGSSGPSSARSGGPYQQQRPPMGGHHTHHQVEKPPVLWASRRAAPAAQSSGMRRVIEPGRPRANSFSYGPSTTALMRGGLGARPAHRYSYRAYHL